MRRDLLTCLLFAVLLLVPIAYAQAVPEENDTPTFDVDADGVLAESDVATMLGICAGTVPVIEQTKMDCNFDECGTAADAAVLLRYVYGDVSRFPAATGGFSSPVASDTEAAARRVIRRVLVIDFAAYEAKLAGTDLTVYGNLAAKQPIFTAMAYELNLAVRHAAESCLPLIAFDVVDMAKSLDVKLPQRRIGWKEMAALYRTFGADTTRRLADSLAVDLDLSGNQNAVFSVELPLFFEILSAAVETEQLTAKFALAYLNTVYDDKGVQTEYVKYELPESYLSGLIHPLNNASGQYWIKDGWYDARSRRTRLHTGTDILAPARTPILSMTDGVVLHVGYMAIPGNYVVVRDPYGFEYHYYHMFEQSTNVEVGDFVAQGDVIGRVGNTGNSAANHLHLTIISPECTYINPYDVFLTAGITPIRIN